MSERKSIKEFLDTVVSDGVAVKSLFEISIFEDKDDAVYKSLSFFITDIDIPGKKLTTSTLYREGREYDIPIIYDNNREFTMTVLCDTTFSTYFYFETLMKAGQHGSYASIHTIIVRPTTDNSDNWDIKLDHVFFESLGPINFSHNSKELITFTVSGRFRDIKLS